MRACSLLTETSVVFSAARRKASMPHNKDRMRIQMNLSQFCVQSLTHISIAGYRFLLRILVFLPRLLLRTSA